jgi:hypothetical protein
LSGELDGAVSTGFCVSVGCPLTSPGFDVDMPGSVRFVPVAELSVLVEGLAGRATLPLEVSDPDDGGVRSPLFVSFVSLVSFVSEVEEPELTLPVPAAFDPAVVSSPLVLVVRLASLVDLCMSLEPLRPCADFALWCLLAFRSAASDSSVRAFFEAVSFGFVATFEPAVVSFEPAPVVWLVELFVLSFGIAAVLLLSSEVLPPLVLRLPELPVLPVTPDLLEVLLFLLSLGRAFEPLSSDGAVVLGLLVLLLVWARAPNAIRASARADAVKIFIREPPCRVRRR